MRVRVRVCLVSLFAQLNMLRETFFLLEFKKMYKHNIRGCFPPFLPSLYICVYENVRVLLRFTKKR